MNISPFHKSLCSLVYSLCCVLLACFNTQHKSIYGAPVTNFPTASPGPGRAPVGPQVWRRRRLGSERLRPDDVIHLRAEHADKLDTVKTYTHTNKTTLSHSLSSHPPSVSLSLGVHQPCDHLLTCFSPLIYPCEISICVYIYIYIYTHTHTQNEYISLLVPYCPPSSMHQLSCPHSSR